MDELVYNTVFLVEMLVIYFMSEFIAYVTFGLS